MQIITKRRRPQNLAPKIGSLFAAFLLFLALTLGTSNLNIANANASTYLDVVVSDSGNANSLANPHSTRKVAVAPNGDIFVIYHGSQGVRVARSTNRGQSFLPSVLVSPNDYEAEIAIATNGYIYVVYPSPNRDYYLVSRSFDNGSNFYPIAIAGRAQAGIAHLATSGSMVYALDRFSNKLYFNETSGVGTFHSTELGPATVTFTELQVDPKTAEVIVVAGSPTLSLRSSVDKGVTFGPLRTYPGAGVYNATSALSVGEAGRYLFLSGGPYEGTTGDLAYRFNLDNGTATALTFGLNTNPKGRSLAADSQGNIVDSYNTSNSSVSYGLSSNLGQNFENPVLVTETAGWISVAINPVYGDIVAVYESGGKIYTTSYLNVLRRSDVALTLTASNPTPVLGETLTLTITASNAGPGIARGIQIKDLLPAGLKYVSHMASQGRYDPVGGLWTVGNLTNSQVESLQIKATITKSNLNITNIASVVKQNIADPNPANDSQSISLKIPASADLNLSQTVDLAKPHFGQIVQFNLNLTNAGPDNATGVQVKALVPSGLNYASHNAGQGSYDPVSGLWKIERLAAGQSATLQIGARVTQSNLTITCSATIANLNEIDPNGANNSQNVSLAVIPAADLNLQNLVDNPAPNIGQPVQFNLSLYNRGPDKSSEIQVSYKLSSGLSYVSHQASQGKYDPASGIWDIGSVVNGQTVTLQIMTIAEQGGLQNSSATVIAKSSYDPDSANNNPTATLYSQGGMVLDGLAAQLRLTPDREFSLASHDLIYYKLIIKNPSDYKASMVHAKLPLDPNLEVAFASFNHPEAWVKQIVTDTAQPYIDMRFPDLVPNQTLIGTVAFRARPGALANHQILTRFTLGWNEPEQAGCTRLSNAVRLTLTPSTTRDESDGTLQPFEKSMSSGGILRLTGDFFSPGEKITLWYTAGNGVSTPLGDAYADSSGRVSFTLNPQNLKPAGSYTIVGYGNFSGISGKALIGFALPS